ncbi:MAG: chromate efflux transporter [Ignavibacteriaceae bacterium]
MNIIENKKPSFIDLIIVGLYLGSTAYGGPAMIGQMKKTIVNDKKWLDEPQFLDAMSFAQILPGATGVLMMGYIGYELKNAFGALIISLFFVLPSAVAIGFLSFIYFNYSQQSFVKALFAGLGAMIVALLADAIKTLGKTVFPKISIRYYKGYIISIVVFVLSYWLKFGSVTLVIISASLGYLFYYFTKDFKNIVIPQPSAVNLNLTGSKNLSKEIFSYSFLGGLTIAFLIIFIFEPEIRVIFLTFFKIGAFAFGGGYNSIPLLEHETVNVYHWVSMNQFRDGLAMGQITPGPVLITATFIGYKVLGIAGAITATTGIFLPSIFAVILLNKVHQKIIQMPITYSLIRGVLAGFIGLLISVTIGFGIQSLISWQTWGIFIVSVVLLIYYKVDPLWIIIGTIIISIIII